MSDFSIIKDMPAVEAAINEESWEWLTDNIPILAEAIYAEITKRNARPLQIRHFVMKSTQRERLAARCYQAACYVAESQKED
jgi:hypothetical protein